MRLDLLPSNLAGCIHEWLSEKHSTRRLYLLVHSFGQVIRFIALCNVCDYVSDRANRNRELDAALVSLKRPSLGHWFQIAREIGRSFEQNGSPLFLLEWPKATLRLLDTVFDNCIDKDVYGPRTTLAPLDALLRLRNILAHGGIPPDNSLSASLCEIYDPIMLHVMEEFSFLQDLDLFQPLRQTENGVEAIALHGLGPHATFIKANFNEAIPDSCCFLQRRSSPERRLAIHPLFLGPTATQYNMTLDEPLFLFEGMGRNRIVYLGIKRKFETESNFDLVTNSLFTPLAANSAALGGPLIAMAIKRSMEAVQINQNVKYFPDVYQERAKYSSLIRDFSSDLSSRLTGLIIVAESGAGKTSLLCDATVQLLSVATPRIIPLFVLARDLVCKPSMTSAGSLTEYMETIFNVNNSSSVEDLLQRINGLLPQAYQKGERCFLLMLDAMNEFSDPLLLLREFDLFVDAARRYSWLKIIGTIRKGAFDVLFSRLAGGEPNWPRSTRAYVRSPNDGGTLSVALQLASFSEMETREAYGRYLERAKSDNAIPACLTPFDHLPDAVRSLVSKPLILRMLMQAYDGQHVAQGVVASTLFERFHTEVLSKEQALTVRSLAIECVRLKVRAISKASVKHILNEWMLAKDEYELLVKLDPMDQLVDLGIFIKTREGDYTFAQQLYMEFLISEHLREERRTPESILAYIKSGLLNPTGYLEEELSSLRSHLRDRTIEDPTIFVSAIVAQIENKAIGRFFTPLFSEIRDRSPTCYGILISEIENTRTPEVLDIAIEMVRTLGDRRAEINIARLLITLTDSNSRKLELEIRLARLFLLSNDHATVSNLLADLSNSIQDTDNLDIKFSYLCELGYRNFTIGRSGKSIQAYDEALTLLGTLQPTLDHEIYLTKRSIVLKGRGCAEHNLDSNKNCLESHAEALEIDRQLGLRESVALDLVNVADAHWGNYNFEVSLRNYREAVDAANRTCFEDARDISQIGHGIVLWSMGRLEEAEYALRSGVALAEQLGYAWDLSYGQIYYSNLLFSKERFAEGIELNEKGLLLAESIDAKYLVAVAQSYLFWKYEARSPGRISTLERIQLAIPPCAELGMRGPEMFLRGLSLLNNSACSNISDEEFSRRLKDIAGAIERSAPFKGPWELLGTQIIHRCKRYQKKRRLFRF